MDEYIKTLSQTLCEIIAKENVSIAVAAELWGLSARELRHLINRGKDVKLSTLVKISEGTGRTVASLICPAEARRVENENFLRRVYAEIGCQLRKVGA